MKRVSIKSIFGNEVVRIVVPGPTYSIQAVVMQ